MACNILAIRMVPWHEKTSEKHSDRTSGTLLRRCGPCARGACSGGFVHLGWTQHRRHGECRSQAYGLPARCLDTNICSCGITVVGALADSVGMDSDSNSLDWCMDSKDNSLDWCMDSKDNSLDWCMDSKDNSLDWCMDSKDNSLDWCVYCFCVYEHP